MYVHVIAMLGRSLSFSACRVMMGQSSNPIDSSVLVSDDSFRASLAILYTGWPKKYSCLIKREMHNKRGFFENEICLDCKWANLKFL